MKYSGEKEATRSRLCSESWRKRVGGGRVASSSYVGAVNSAQLDLGKYGGGNMPLGRNPTGAVFRIRPEIARQLGNEVRGLRRDASSKAAAFSRGTAVSQRYETSMIILRRANVNCFDAPVVSVSKSGFYSPGVTEDSQSESGEKRLARAH